MHKVLEPTDDAVFPRSFTARLHSEFSKIGIVSECAKFVAWSEISRVHFWVHSASDSDCNRLWSRDLARRFVLALALHRLFAGFLVIWGNSRAFAWLGMLWAVAWAVSLIASRSAGRAALRCLVETAARAVVGITVTAEVRAALRQRASDCCGSMLVFGFGARRVLSFCSRRAASCGHLLRCATVCVLIAAPTWTCVCVVVCRLRVGIGNEVGA